MILASDEAKITRGRFFWDCTQKNWSAFLQFLSYQSPWESKTKCPNSTTSTLLNSKWSNEFMRYFVDSIVSVVTLRCWCWHFGFYVLIKNKNADTQSYLQIIITEVIWFHFFSFLYSWDLKFHDHFISNPLLSTIFTYSIMFICFPIRSWRNPFKSVGWTESHNWKMDFCLRRNWRSRLDLKSSCLQPSKTLNLNRITC